MLGFSDDDDIDVMSQQERAKAICRENNSWPCSEYDDKLEKFVFRIDIGRIAIVAYRANMEKDKLFMEMICEAIKKAHMAVQMSNMKLEMVTKSVQEELDKYSD